MLAPAKYISRIAQLFLWAALSSSPLYAQATVAVRVDASANLGPVKPIWAYFGYDEPNYTYAPHGRELISELSALSAMPVHLRTHNLLTTGDGTASLKWGSTNAYTEDASGKPVYDWKITDEILDTYLRSGAEPYVEIGFMPEALSIKPEPYRHTFPKGPLFTGWSYPPNDYQKWAELVHQWVLHCVQRYGAAEVKSWNWEVWNEPDIGYWHGTPEEYDKLYDFTADAVKRAFPAARIGGPATTGPANARAAAFLRQFLEHCAHGANFSTGKMGAPLDFISFHAKGAPQFFDGHQRMGIARQLRDVQEGFEIIKSFPEFAARPVVLSESDPDGCAACTPAMDPRYGYRNTSLYPAYTAVVLDGVRQLAAKYHIHVEGMLTWAFEFEDHPYFEGLRTLATNGIDQPELNLFRMAGLMRGDEVKAESSGAMPLPSIIQSGVRGGTDVNAIAARGDRDVTVMLWNYQDDAVPGPATPVSVTITGIPVAERRILLRHYRIDRDHSSAYAAWLEMGSPQTPTPEQYEQLKAAGQLQLLDSPRWITNENGAAVLSLKMPLESLSLLELTW